MKLSLATRVDASGLDLCPRARGGPGSEALCLPRAPTARPLLLQAASVDRLYQSVHKSTEMQARIEAIRGTPDAETKEALKRELVDTMTTDEDILQFVPSHHVFNGRDGWKMLRQQMKASKFRKCASVDSDAAKLAAVLPDATTRLHAIFFHLRELHGNRVHTARRSEKRKRLRHDKDMDEDDMEEE